MPVRFVAESFSAKVGWDNTYYIVQINKSGVSVNSSLIDWRYTKRRDFSGSAGLLKQKAAVNPQVVRLRLEMLF